MRGYAAISLLLIGGSLLLASSCGGGSSTRPVTATPVPAASSKANKAQPVSTLVHLPYLAAGPFQFLDDNRTGWLGASTCIDQPGGTAPSCTPGLYGTTDGGQTWTLLTNHTPEEFQFDSPQIGLAVDSNQYCPNSPCPSTVRRTTDGGKHWAETYSSTDRLSLVSVIDEEAWVLADGCGHDQRSSNCEWYVLQSQDEGLTWRKVPLSITAWQLMISRPTRHDAWITTITGGGRSAQLFVTHDDGMTWTQLPHPTGYAFESEIFFRTAREGWLLIGGQPGAGSQDKHLYGTTDGGLTWEHLSDGIGGRYLGPLVFTSSQEGWMASAHASGLDHTTDGGKTWASLSIERDNADQRDALQFTDTLHGWTMSDYYLEQPPILQLEQALWSTSAGGVTWQRVPLPVVPGGVPLAVTPSPTACNVGANPELTTPPPSTQALPTSSLPATVTASGLRIIDLKVGTGQEAQPGAVVSVTYREWLPDGTLVDETSLHGTPVPVREILRPGRTMAGLLEGMAGMKVGGERRLIIPPNLAFGSQCGGTAVPLSSSTFIFDIELVAILPQ